MKEIKQNNQHKILKLGLFAISLIPILFYFYLLAERVPIPFDLEWGEGAGINQIGRIISGEVLYGEPTLEFAPLVYGPTYYWVSSLVARMIKNSLLAGRLISAAASIGSAGLIIWMVAREGAGQLGAWLAGALYLACFHLSEGFYDLVRVDSFYVLLLLAAVFVLRSAHRPSGMLGAGMLIALGFFTKQSALLVFAPLVLYLLVVEWKRSWLILPISVLGILVPFWLLNSRSDGWFFYYLFVLPAEHGFSILTAAQFWLSDLLGPLGIALAFGLFALVFRDRYIAEDEGLTARQGPERGGDRKVIPGEIFFGIFAIGAVGSAWLTRAVNGGGANNAMPAYAVLALLFGLGYNRAEQLLSNGAMHRSKSQLLLASLVAIQFLGLIYNPFRYLPTRDEYDANLALIARIAEIEEPVLIPYRSHLSLLAGKGPAIHVVNLFELTGYFKGDIRPEGRELVREIQEGICRQEYGLIVLDQPMVWFEREIKAAYQLEKSFLGAGKPGTNSLLGWQGGLSSVYIPLDDYHPADCLQSIDDKSEEKR